MSTQPNFPGKHLIEDILRHQVRGSLDSRLMNFQQTNLPIKEQKGVPINDWTVATNERTNMTSSVKNSAIPKSLKATVVLLFMAGTLLVLIMYIGGRINEAEIISLLGAIFATILIMLRPYFGLAILFVAIPLQQAFPTVPIGTSILTLVGGLTVFAYLVQEKYRFGTKDGKRSLFSHSEFAFAAGFIVWTTVSHPTAAILPQGNRIWFLTYAQLLLLVVLAGSMMTPRRQQILMAAFILIMLYSAAVSIPDAVREGLTRGARASGLVGNANGLGLFFAMAIPMVLHLRTQFREIHWWQLLSPFILFAFLLGVTATVSRSALLAVISTFAFIFLCGEKLLPDTTKIQRRLLLPVLLVVGMLLLPPGYLQYMSGLADNITLDAQSNRHADLRPFLWESAIGMWIAHPVAGVGLGRFTQINRTYIDPFFADEVNGVPTHNTFFSVLAETGIVGLALFCLWLASVGRTLWRTMQRSKNPQVASIAAVWLIIFVQILLVGLTHSLHYDKMLWFTAGISLFLASDTSHNVSKQRDMFVRL